MSTRWITKAIASMAWRGAHGKFARDGQKDVYSAPPIGATPKP